MLLRGVLYSLGFLLCVTVFAKVHSRAVRQSVLLVVSYGLYFTWGAWFTLVLFFSTVMNFLVGQWLRRRESRLVLAVGILLNLALLGIFKYLPQSALTIPLSSLQRFAYLALPLGISFWTFQAMSYLFDVYRGEEVDPTFSEFALYMVFFPVVISGPICRLPDMLLQFRSQEATKWSHIAAGFRRIAIGVFMMQLAKLLGQGILAGDGINSGFDRLTRWSGADVWCLAFGFGLQLFFDFAGYSHIAIGAARALGVTLPENFARPFHSNTPSIFWTRWHMSLSFWIRDYVFLPLAMMRREVLWRNVVLVISMVMFGVWHKATALFVLWGSYHGVLLVLHRQVQFAQRRFDWSPPEPFWTFISWLVTISLVSLGWIFFRANSLPQATQMLSAVLSPTTYSSHSLTVSLYLLVAGLAAGYAIVLWLADALGACSVEPDASPVHSEIMVRIARWRWFWLPPLYAVALLFLSIITFTRSGGAAQLMYRRF
jgi:alginate O-acetyltransferase complex protein AlgI